jgi:hypothetical protein
MDMKMDEWIIRKEMKPLMWVFVPVKQVLSHYLSFEVKTLVPSHSNNKTQSFIIS